MLSMIQIIFIRELFSFRVFEKVIQSRTQPSHYAIVPISYIDKIVTFGLYKLLVIPS